MGGRLRCDVDWMDVVMGPKAEAIAITDYISLFVFVFYFKNIFKKIKIIVLNLDDIKNKNTYF